MLSNFYALPLTCMPRSVDIEGREVKIYYNKIFTFYIIRSMVVELLLMNLVAVPKIIWQHAYYFYLFQLTVFI